YRGSALSFMLCAAEIASLKSPACENRFFCLRETARSWCGANITSSARGLLSALSISSTSSLPNAEQPGRFVSEVAEFLQVWCAEERRSRRVSITHCFLFFHQ